MLENHVFQQPVDVVHEGSVTTITINNPERSNRINVQAMRLLISGITAAEQRDSLILVIRAEGDDFTLGRDQSEKPAGLTRRDSLKLILDANTQLQTFSGISIALIQGRALGFGSGLAAQADISIAAEDATLGFDEVLHGLAPLVVAEYLGKYIGAKAVCDLLFTGRSVSATEALRLDMISRVVSASRLNEEGESLVDHLLSLEAGALRLMKAYLLKHSQGELADPQVQAVDWLDQ